MQKFWIGFASGILLFLVIIFAVILYFNSGSFNITAISPDNFLSGIMDTIKDKAVDRNSEKLVLDITDKNFDAEKGKSVFLPSCASCHGTPEYDRKDYASYMDPVPPDLSDKDEVGDLTDGNLYWIIENGIKMTGMPAFSKIKTEKDVKNIILFIKKMQDEEK